MQYLCHASLYNPVLQDFLTSHKGFIAAEAASPVLVDAFMAFKRGWDEFRRWEAAVRGGFLVGA